MSFIHRHLRVLLVGACCAAAGAGFSAIAVAGATTTNTHARPAHVAARHRWLRHHGRGLRRVARHAVHADVVVPTRSGFATVTFDRGTVATVSGQQLTITEGTRKATYRTVTLTIPSTAVVRDDRQTSTLSAVTAGQRVFVVQGPKRTAVIARTPQAG